MPYALQTRGIVVDAADNVGIGTADPKAALQIDTDTLFDLSSTPGDQDNLLLTDNVTGAGQGNVFASIGFGNNPNSRRAAMAALQTGDDVDRQGIAFYTHPSNVASNDLEEKMRIRHDGRVGIGTTSPTDLLHVIGTARFDVDTGSGEKVRITTPQGAPGLIATSANGNRRDIRFADSGISIVAGTTAGAPGAAEGVRINEGGHCGIGATSPLGRAHVRENSLSLNATALNNEDIIVEDADAVLGLYSSAGGTFGSTLAFGETDGAGLLEDKWTIGRRTSNATVGPDFEIRYGSAANQATNDVMVCIDETGLVGIGTTSPAAKLDVGGKARLFDVLGGAVELLTPNGTSTVSLISGLDGSGQGAVLTLKDSTGDNTIFLNGSNGVTSTKVLRITGADLAEKFPVREAVEPGTVVEIDPDHPGSLRLARGAYNRRVAGVVSGANGLSVGIVLGNLPGHEDAPPVAMSGRVWTLCDATSGPIRPGDLLTTSETPGHGMAVADHTRAQGAIIGKAMSSLEAGTGLVLVLVSLQ